MKRQEKAKTIQGPETDKVRKTFLEKLKSFFCFCTAKKNKDLSDEPQKTCLEKIRLLICCCKAKKRPEKQKQNKSLRIYIKQNWKWVISLLVVYIIISGAVVSVPILVNHFRVMNRNETEQERSII